MVSGQTANSQKWTSEEFLAVDLQIYLTSARVWIHLFWTQPEPSISSLILFPKLIITFLKVIWKALVSWHGFMANALHRWEHSLEKSLEIVPCTIKNNMQNFVIFCWEKKSKLLVFFYIKVYTDFYLQHKSGTFSFVHHYSKVCSSKNK